MNANAQKLSLSSADSSSSAPNSPPPNYEDVFDSTGSNYPLITNPAILQFQQDNKCFDNKTYFHKGSSSSSPGFKIERSNKSSFSQAVPHSSHNNLVFSFTDINELNESSLRHSIDEISPIFPLKVQLKEVQINKQ